MAAKGAIIQSEAKHFVLIRNERVANCGARVLLDMAFAIFFLAEAYHAVWALQLHIPLQGILQFPHLHFHHVTHLHKFDFRVI